MATITVLVFCLSAARGENLTTLDGRTLTNVVSMTNYSSVVVIKHDGGMTGVKPSNLSEDFRAKYGIKIKTNAVATATRQTLQPASPTDVFLAQHKDSDFKVTKSIDQHRTNLISGSTAIIDIHDCELSVIPKGFIFTTYSFKCDSSGDMETNGADAPVILGFRFGEEPLVRQIFDKYIEWEAIAATNNAQNFEKTIVSIREPAVTPYGSDEFRSFTFRWDRDAIMGKDARATLGASYPVMNFDMGSLFYGSVEKSDILAFGELLKSVPELKEELVQKLRSQETQKDLFK